ncbi:arylsulfatase [Pseudomaricurvus sp. HS19]|uniref:arylsulfatase n=1 Tax=Pseudomaricurvus sp. HS19 TaxID=2692626 RepID=UPI00136BD6F8|nr:arylsulfatase [Pseudomaricurvus sp. HS19]MYM64004.1 sulfatase-like hydrolase/transferase [Pseudomaricurvus sp. HS19]
MMSKPMRMGRPAALLALLFAGTFSAQQALALDLAVSADDLAKSIPGTRPERVTAEADAPNVLVWLMDDVGFAQVSAYGGLVETPNIDRVAANGLAYSNFRATPVCSSSRASLLTGRNPHTVNVGGHAMGPRGLPGYNTLVPRDAGTAAENFRQAGYRTFAIGKWDHGPLSDLNAAGPFTYWPQGQGFDRFYGFLTADTDNFDPVLFENIAPVDIPKQENYHFNKDMADKAIDYINGRSSGLPTPPFYMYWATGTAHAPHHAPADWIAKYKGRFDKGWDAVREEILAKQKALGIVPADTKLPPRPEHMPAWDSLSADAKRLYARQMEVFAASLSYADHEFGRVLDELERRGELDNTIVVITSDNGASAEGGPNGLMNEISFPNSHVPTVAENLAWIDQWGGPETFPHYVFGWAVAGNTPYNYYKQTAWEGGIRVPLVIAWPEGIKARGEWREQFAYIADITPTVLAAAGVEPAKMVNNLPQIPFDGENLVGTFAKTAETPDRAQYFEMYGNRSLVKGDWKIVASDRTATWDLTTSASVDNAWALYNLKTDPAETINLADQHPDKVAELDAAFEAQAEQFHVNPIDGGGGTRVYMRQIITEDFKTRRGQWVYPRPVARTLEFNAPPIKFMNHTMTADVNLPQGNETGPIYAMGGSLGGMGLYLKDGKPTFIIRGLMGEEVKVTGKALSKGDNQLEMTLDLGGGSQAHIEPLAVRNITVTLSSNGNELLNETVQFAMPATMSSSETFDIGRDDGKALTDDYTAETPFPGTIRNVVFDFMPKGLAKAKMMMQMLGNKAKELLSDD